MNIIKLQKVRESVRTTDLSAVFDFQAGNVRSCALTQVILSVLEASGGVEHGTYTWQKKNSFSS